MTSSYWLSNGQGGSCDAGSDSFGIDQDDATDTEGTHFLAPTRSKRPCTAPWVGSRQPSLDALHSHAHGPLDHTSASSLQLPGQGQRLRSHQLPVPVQVQRPHVQQLLDEAQADPPDEPLEPGSALHRVIMACCLQANVLGVAVYNRLTNQARGSGHQLGFMSSSRGLTSQTVVGPIKILWQRGFIRYCLRHYMRQGVVRHRLCACTSAYACGRVCAGACMTRTHDSPPPPPPACRSRCCKPQTSPRGPLPTRCCSS